MSQSKLAELASIPRATCSHLESGSANPTLQVLTKVSDALAIGVDELLGPPRFEVALYKADTRTYRKRGAAQITDLIPESIEGVHIEVMTLPRDSSFAGSPHRDGSREYFACEQGSIEVVVAGDRWTLSQGDVFVFPGAQKHSYLNRSSGTSVGISVIVAKNDGESHE